MNDLIGLALQFYKLKITLTTHPLALTQTHLRFR